MTRIYFSAAHAIETDAGGGDFGEIRVPSSVTTFEPEPSGPRNTGLLDSRGQTIMAADMRERIGFCIWKA